MPKFEGPSQIPTGGAQEKRPKAEKQPMTIDQAKERLLTHNPFEQSWKQDFSEIKKEMGASNFRKAMKDLYVFGAESMPFSFADGLLESAPGLTLTREVDLHDAEDLLFALDLSAQDTRNLRFGIIEDQEHVDDLNNHGKGWEDSEAAEGFSISVDKSKRYLEALRKKVDVWIAALADLGIKGIDQLNAREEIYRLKMKQEEGEEEDEG